MSLYIRGSINMYAKIDHLKPNKHDAFEMIEDELCNIQEFAKAYDVYIELESIDESFYGFTIHNIQNDFGICLQGYTSFEIDLSIKDDDDFEVRANKFLIAFNKESRFKPFHNFEFSKIKKRYFVST